MVALLCFMFAILSSPFKSKIRLEAENTVLRHQLIVLRRQVRGRVRLTKNDRLLFVQLYRWVPSILKVLTIIRPETLIGWHRAGFRRYWRWKSRARGGRPQIEANLRALIGRMLTVISDTGRALADIIDTERSLRLERIIIALILLETIFAGYQLLFR